MFSAKLSKNDIHPLESPEYNFVNEELLKICFEKRDPIKPVRQSIANRIIKMQLSIRYSRVQRINYFKYKLILN